MPFVSLIVAVTVEVVVPSARIDAGDAVRVELVALAVAAAGLIATMTEVSSRFVIVELFAAIGPGRQPGSHRTCRSPSERAASRSRERRSPGRSCRPAS